MGKDTVRVEVRSEDPVLGMKNDEKSACRYAGKDKPAGSNSA